MTYRCIFYALNADDLWGTDNYVGLVDQFEQSVAGHHHIAAGDNSVILIDLQDAARPWDSAVETDKKLERPRMAIVRVQFRGGIQTTRTDNLITAVEITPQYQ